VERFGLFSERVGPLFSMFALHLTRPIGVYILAAPLCYASQ
jgi:hypothetical protein